MSETPTVPTIKVASCWDDGIIDDIRAIEILRKHGAKGSFNLNIGLHSEQRQGGWKYKNVKDVGRLGRNELTDVYDGFLVANHTAKHPHPTKLSPVEATKDIRDGRDGLEQLFGYVVTGFAYPFGDYDDAVKEMVREAGHVYARTTKSVDTIFPVEDPMAFHANCHFLVGDFWERFERAAPSGVFYFWGHTYELVTEDDWTAFDEKIERLSTDSRVVWVDLPTLFE